MNESRAVARFLCLGRGAVPEPNKFFEPRSGDEIFLPSREACFPGKFLKYRVRDWQKNAFSEISALTYYNLGQNILNKLLF